MTRRLRDNLDDLAALVNQVANATGVPAAFIEKDFWLTEVLRAAVTPREVVTKDGASHPVMLVFKGGTSLSRVFGLIERFSEDVDVLAVFPPEVSEKQRDKFLKNVHADVEAHLHSAGSVARRLQSTTGVKRDVAYSYPAAGASDALKNGVTLELGSRGGPQPSQDHTIASMVTQYAVQELGEAEETWEEFVPVTVRVLSPARTLAEKLAAVHHAASAADSAAIARNGRHYYDIARLLNDSRVRDELESLGDKGRRHLFDDIEQHTTSAGWSSTPRPDGGYADSPAFDPDSGVWDEIAAAYQAAEALVFGQMPSLDEVVATVRQFRTLL